MAKVGPHQTSTISPLAGADQHSGVEGMRKQWIALLLAFGMTTGIAVSQKKANDHDADDKKPARVTGKAQPVKIVKGPVVEWVGEKTAVIAWSTNVRSSTILRYGTNPSSLTHQADAAYGGPTHRVRLNNLTPSTKYYYTLDDTKAQGTGTQAQSQVYEFETVAKGQKGKRYTFVKTKD
jgi:Purple acid Phosphatase, N-terminal domain